MSNEAQEARNEEQPGGDAVHGSPVCNYPAFPENLPGTVSDEGRYSVRFARSAGELDAVQRLRFEVFNLEMGEGLEESYETGRDRDRFDEVCHHLLVIEKAGGMVVGTYRMQTSAMAQRHGGFYSAEEFSLESMPAEVIDDAIEVGRASVAKPYRNRAVLFLLWKGLAAYMQKNRKRFLFGCCSLTSQDSEEGRRVMQYLSQQGHVHPTYRAAPRPGWECYPAETESLPCAGVEQVKLPQLFKLYLRCGAKVCGPPALDRFFKTIDYLVLLDIEALDANMHAMFFGDPP